MQSAALDSLLNLETVCPNFSSTTTTTIPWELSSLNMTSLSETIHSSLQEIDTFMETRVHDAEIGLTKVMHATAQVDTAMSWFEENEWKPRLYIVVLIVVTIFLLVGILLSRNNISFNPLECVTMYLLVPTFCVCLVLSALGTYGFGASAVINADFCAGGDYPGSPVGTIDAIMKQQGVSQSDITFQSFHYYVEVSGLLCGWWFGSIPSHCVFHTVS